MSKIEDCIGKEKYFVHKGTWKNDYEWRIQKVKIAGIKMDDSKELFVEFSFGSCGYDYPFSWLKDTYKEAQEFAVKQIAAEKKRQTAQILKPKGIVITM